MLLNIIIFIACNKSIVNTPPQTPSETKTSTENTQTEDSKTPEKPKAPTSNQHLTQQLLTTGILDPVPSEVYGDVTIQFRTMYRNGCWSQSEVETKIEGTEITHSYTTLYDGEGKICTMALKPGGFKETIPLLPATYNGTIIVDGDTRTTYTVSVLP